MSQPLPHAPEAERALIGTCLLIPHGYALAARSVSAEDFYHPAHEAIWRAIGEVIDRGEPVDVLSVADALTRSGFTRKVGDLPVPAYMGQLQGEAYSAETIPHRAQQVRAQAVRRRVIVAAAEVRAKAHDPRLDLGEFLSEVDQAMSAAMSGAQVGGAVPLKRALHEALSQVDAAFGKGDSVIGVPSGFSRLDALTAGWQAGDEIVIAGRPSMGKSAFAWACVRNAARLGIPSFIASAEMVRAAVAMREIAIGSGQNLGRVRTGQLGREGYAEVTAAVTEAMAWPVWIDDRSRPSLRYLRSEIKRWIAKEAPKSKHPQALLVFDYLQILDGTRRKQDNHEREVAELSAGIKALAKDTGCAALTLSQLNRGVEARTDKRPMMSDLRDSGAIEQDADVVAFLYRDEFYNRDTPTPGVCEVIVAKQRQGATATVPLRFDATTTTFRELGVEEYRSWLKATGRRTAESAA